MNNSKLLGLFSVIAIFSSVACSSPDTSSKSATDSQDGAVKVANSHSYRLTASSDTKSALGVSTWHVLTQADTKTIVLEGVDASGNVKFATSFREEGDTVRIDSYKVASGKLTLKKSGAEYKLTSNTIAAEKWDKFAAAYAADSNSGNIVQEYAFRGKLSGLKKLGGLVSKGISKISDAYNAYQAGKSVWDAITGKDDKDSKSDTKSDANDSNSKDSTDDKAGDNKDDSKDDNAEDNKDDTKDDNADDNKDDGKDENADDNTDENKDDNKDENADQNGDEAADGNDGGDANDEGDVSADSGDENLDESAGDNGDNGDNGDDGASESGGDEGGGEEFALHNKCKHLSYGKTSKVYICTKY